MQILHITHSFGALRSVLKQEVLTKGRRTKNQSMACYSTVLPLSPSLPAWLSIQWHGRCFKLITHCFKQNETRRSIMKRVLMLAVIALFALAPLAYAASGPMGPATNSGDGISDGSGFDTPNGPNSTLSTGKSVGPAPNSGDGIPDGSGFDDCDFSDCPLGF
jgi:hypothetical protein